jgi:hypothetical protein
MRETTLSIPKRIMIAGARVALGIGVGLLLSRKMSRDARRGVGGALLEVNVITSINVTNTFPIVIDSGTKPDSHLEHPAA